MTNKFKIHKLITAVHKQMLFLNKPYGGIDNDKKQVVTKLDWIEQLLEMDADERTEYIKNKFGYDYSDDYDGSNSFIKGVVQGEIKQLQENI